MPINIPNSELWGHLSTVTATRIYSSLEVFDMTGTADAGTFFRRGMAER
jgi:hypothetical protein